MLREIEPLFVSSDDTILRALEVMDRGGMQIVLVVDDHRRLLATLTDGDVRRGLLRGVGLDQAVEQVMHRDAATVGEAEGAEAMRRLFAERDVRHLPVIDENGVVVALASSEDADRSAVARETPVVLMAGGLGKRLRPLTQDIPKPMLPVGGRPLLEIILENFKAQGFRNFILSVNYRKDIIQNHFDDGARFDCTIEYIEEDQRMGTAGALSLLGERPSEPLIVMNGDLLTATDFVAMLDHHGSSGATGTIGAREYSIEVPYGVIEGDGAQLRAIVEKPVHRHLINAGIYVLSPAALDYLEVGRYCDMPELFKRMMEDGSTASIFPLREYWLDIGAFSDLERARKEVDTLLMP